MQAFIRSVFKRIFNATQESYLLANRNTGFFPLVATLTMTELNPTTLIAFSSVGYKAELRGLLMPMIVLYSMLFYAFVAAKKWKMFNGTCVTEFFYQRYGRGIGRFSQIVLFLSMLGLSATYIKAMTVFFVFVNPGIDTWTLSMIIVTICLLITLKGGLNAVIRMDIISVGLVVFLLIFCFHTSWHDNNINFSFLKDNFSVSKYEELLPLKFICIYSILSSFTYILMPAYGQKIFSAKNEKIAYSAALSSALLVFLFYAIAIASTGFLKLGGIVLDNAEEAFPYILHNLLPSVLKPIAYVVFFLIGSTTICGVWSAMAALLVVAFKKNETTSANFSIYMVLVSAVLSYFMGNLFVDNLLDKLILVNILIFSLSFALIAGFYWKGVTTQGVYVSVVVGLLWGGLSFFFSEGDFNHTWRWMAYGIPLIFGAGVGASLFSISKIFMFRRLQHDAPN